MKIKVHDLTKDALPISGEYVFAIRMGYVGIARFDLSDSCWKTLDNEIVDTVPDGIRYWIEFIND